MLLKSGQLVFYITRMLAIPRDVFDWHTIGGKKKGKLLLAQRTDRHCTHCSEMDASPSHQDKRIHAG